MANYLTLDIQTGETILKSATVDQSVANEIVSTDSTGHIHIELLPNESVNIVKLQASETIPSGKIVSIDSQGKVKLYTHTDVPLGILKNNVQSGNTAIVITTGSFEIVSPLGYNGPIYADVNGDISTTPDILVQQIGIISGNILVVNIYPPIELLGVTG